MKRIKRNMTSEQIDLTANNNISEYLPHCQASFNSNGNITLRNYDKSDKNRDEIIILSQSETEALFKLFYEMKQNFAKHELPF